MKIFMWSGPRNISTALLRSFSNRDDTIVYDEPFYSYYLYETQLNHPMKREILNFYPTKEKEVINSILKNNDKIFYQKHITTHILDKTNIEWLNQGINCFLIRDPAKVINSYVKKNKLKNISDVGFHQILRLFNHVKNNISEKVIVLNADLLLEDPDNYLRKLCNILNISFTDKMLHWEKGKIDDYGIWYKHWYGNIINSTGFKKNNNEEIFIDKKFDKIYKNCLEIYNLIDSYSIKL